MKKHFRLLIVSLVLISVLFITGCGGKKEDKKDYKKEVAGTYEGKYTKLVGDDTKNYEEFSLVLNEDGTGKHNRNNSSYDVEWDFDGEKFTMKDKFMGLTIDYNGTLEDGVLQIYNGKKEDTFTYLYYYEKAN